MVDYSVTSADLERLGIPYRKWGDLFDSTPVDIRALLDRVGGFVLLYETEPHEGHWVLLTKRSADTLEFLDPYGLEPDRELKWAKYSAHETNGRALLAAFLDEWKWVDYLGSPIQEWAPNINTCGRYAILRWFDRQPTLLQWLTKYGFSQKTLQENDARVVGLTSQWLA
jgi:hypothetical protein